MIPNNFWHWLSGLMAVVPLWILSRSPIPSTFVKLIYCGLAIAVPVLANYVNELRDKYHFWSWLPYSWGSYFDIWDIARCVPLAVVCCIVWWNLV